MFIPKTLEGNKLLRNYLVEPAEIVIDDNPNSFENQYVFLTIAIDQLSNFANNTWKCPKDKRNRQILSEFNWEVERQALLAYGKDLEINAKAQLCSTFHKFGISYLIWLEFTGPDLIAHKIDCFISEKSKNGKDTYAIKVVDGIPCENIYNDILNKGIIMPVIARKLNSIGSITWTGSAEHKVQYKLNSFIQQKLFEKVAAECPFVELRQLDYFDDYFYRGDPGQLADYDIIITCKDGSKVTTRIDLKLLRDISFENIAKQNPHDADLILATELFSTAKVNGGRFKNQDVNIKIEETEEFKKFINLFKQALEKTPPKYIKIFNIDTKTGKVTYSFFS